MDESDLDSTIEPSQKDVFDSTHLSDVIEVIEETDPDFTKQTTSTKPSFNKTNNNTKSSSPMFNGGGKIVSTQKPSKSSHISSVETSKSQAYVRIIEQPASKALRFRYECEGRCAGSIPGASSTPENKTYPEIQVEGYKGRAVVVVSCVMKDPPYAVHPHNLVGREGCKKGVCTLEIPPETMRIQFSNLGIQCVKKRDIESSLRQREEIRVDPFKQHYQHKNQPGSIDLNAVRLCFQVFIEGNVAGQITGSLTPVVSDIIYDKKAMSDLAIIKLSDCVSYVDGGRKDIILLCEKVAKEDIEIHFYELENGKKVWEAKADFQPTQVHKQHAIWFRTPRYHKIDITEPVKVFIQLYRPSDQVTSAPLPFELLPLDAGRPPYWSFKRDMANKMLNYELFNTILTNDRKQLLKRQRDPSTNNVDSKEIVETNNGSCQALPSYGEIKKTKLNTDSNDDDDVIITSITKDEEKSFNELIDQVAELDEIYTETQIKLLNDPIEPSATNGQLQQTDSFDDTRTYTSLQLAFKNPIDILDAAKNFDDVFVSAESTPQIEPAAFAPLDPPLPVKPPALPPKRDNNDSTTLPPLPPKRTKKLETYIGGSMSSIQLSGKQADILLTRSGSMRSTAVSRTPSFNLQRPKSQGELASSAPGKHLPPLPNASAATLPSPKRRGFFSKLFGRRSSKSTVTPMTSREASVTPSSRSVKSLQVDNTLSKSCASDKRIKRKRLNNQTFNVNHLEQDRLPHNQHQLFNPGLLQEPIKVEPRDSTSPYNATAFATSMYQGNSPNYVQSPAISPHYFKAPTPSPENIYGQQPINLLDIGGYQHFQAPNANEIASGISWNIPAPQQQHQVVPDLPNNLGSLLDLDNAQISSGTLNNTINNMVLAMDTADQLADIGNLSITDIQVNNNNSDSLSNIILKATQNI